MNKMKFLISGGGTGGHIYPAISIADELKRRYPDAEFLFVGASDRMEMEKVPNAGYEIIGLWISGIQRKLTLKNLIFPIKLIYSLLKSIRIVSSFKPNVVVGTGGYASAPVLYVAGRRNIATVIQEQNSFPGITNKILGKYVDRICVAYDNLDRFFPKNKIIKTGNPVRQDLVDLSSKRPDGIELYNLDKNRKTLVVIGGSLGAKRINQLLEMELEFLVNLGFQIIWQCGKLYFEEYKKNNEVEHVQVHAFLNDMAATYAAADVIVSRAGASSISELCLVGKPVLFIPSPNVAEDHQTKNAMAVVDNDAAILIKESELDEKFRTAISSLYNKDDLILKLSTNIKKMAMKNATMDIVSEIEKIMTK